MPRFCYGTYTDGKSTFRVEMPDGGEIKTAPGYFIATDKAGSIHMFMGASIRDIHQSDEKPLKAIK